MDDLDGVLPNPLINAPIDPTGPGVPALDPTITWGGVRLEDRPPPSPMVSSFDPGSQRFALGNNMLGANPAGVTALADTGKAMASDMSGFKGNSPGSEIDKTQRAVLDRIASGEAPGYNVMYGGKRFEDYSDHPRVGFKTPDGQMTHAAGLYQFQPGTWDPLAKALGLKNFSPASQDKAAWKLANDTYQKNTGRSLYEDAKGGSVDWKALAGEWPSLSKGPGPWTDRSQDSLGGSIGDSGGGSTVPQSMKSLVPGRKALEAPDWGPSVEDPESKSFAELLQNSTLKDNMAKLYPLMLLQSLAPKHKFTPVEYDPFKLVPDLTGTKSRA